MFYVRYAKGGVLSVPIVNYWSRRGEISVHCFLRSLTSVKVGCNGQRSHFRGTTVVSSKHKAVFPVCYSKQRQTVNNPQASLLFFFARTTDKMHVHVISKSRVYGRKSILYRTNTSHRNPTNCCPGTSKQCRACSNSICLPDGTCSGWSLYWLFGIAEYENTIRGLSGTSG